MAYNAELQMLREFFLLHAPQVTCRFCGEPIILHDPDLTFGHRRHIKIRFDNYTVHHEDEDRDNNEFSNLKDSHSSCHRRYHRQKRKETNHGEQEDERKSAQEVEEEVLKGGEQCR